MKAQQTDPHNGIVLNANTFTRTGHTFDGWNTAIENVTGDAVYRAKYSPATRLYTVTLQQPANGTISIVGTTVNEFARGTRIKLAYSGDGTFGVQAWHARTEDETDVELSVTGAGMYPAFIMPAQGITVSATMAPAKTLAIQARNQQNVLSNDKISICMTTVNG